MLVEASWGQLHTSALPCPRALVQCYCRVISAKEKQSPTARVATCLAVRRTVLCLKDCPDSLFEDVF